MYKTLSHSIIGGLGFFNFSNTENKMFADQDLIIAYYTYLHKGKPPKIISMTLSSLYRSNCRSVMAFYLKKYNFNNFVVKATKKNKIKFVKNNFELMNTINKSK